MFYPLVQGPSNAIVLTHHPIIRCMPFFCINLLKIIINFLTSFDFEVLISIQISWYYKFTKKKIPEVTYNLGRKVYKLGNRLLFVLAPSVMRYIIIIFFAPLREANELVLSQHHHINLSELESNFTHQHVKNCVFLVWMCYFGRDRFLKSLGRLKQLPLMRRLQSLKFSLLHFTQKKC